ncbi:MAG: DUF3800 domain-containing protein [Dermatophilaceae bacterium]
MLLAYLDESYTKERYFIAAVLVPDASARPLTQALDGIVTQTSEDHPDLSRDAELHGYDIVAGKADWECLAPRVRVRIGVFDKALQALAAHDVRLVIRSVDIVGLDRRHPNGHDHPHSIVMTHLVERIDEYAEKAGHNALLIADEVTDQDTYRRDLGHYQRLSTWGYRSRQITHIVDTLHFAPSTASRLVQAADLVAYLARRIATHTETDPRAERANARLWSHVQPLIVHEGCWWPRPR